MRPLIKFVNPLAMSRPNGFSHVGVDMRNGVVHISGQVAYDGDGKIVGEGDLAKQTARTLDNIRVALESVGLTFQDVVKMTYFVVRLNSDAAATIREVRQAYFSPDHLPASTMIGVASLAREELLLEIEAQAVLRNP